MSLYFDFFRACTTGVLYVRRGARTEKVGREATICDPVDSSGYVPRPRILMFSSAYLPAIGGAELALKETTDRLPDIEFDLVTLRFEPQLPAEEVIGNVLVHRVGSPLTNRSFLLPKALFPLTAFVRALRLYRQRRRYSAIFALQASQGAGAAWLLKFFYPRTPFIVNVQEGKDLDRQSWLTRFLRRRILKSTDLVTVISSYLRDKIMELGISPQRVSIIPNGVDIANFSRQFADNDLKQLRGHLGIQDNEKVIITASRLVYKNGIDDLIKALAYLKKYAIKVIIVGDGEDRQMLEGLATDLSLKERVSFIGSVSHADLPKYLAIADVFVRPSRTEGLGNAFLEAMAARVPIIGTPVGGIPDFLEPGLTGLFAQPDDPQSIAHAITEILENPDLRKSLIENGYELVSKNYSWDLIAEKYREIFMTYKR